MPGGVFPLAVVTPEARLVECEARSLVVRSSEGFFTVLDGHTPFVADVIPGEIRVEPAEGDVIRLAVHGGAVQVNTGRVPSSGELATQVTVLAGVAERAEDIDTDRAEAARTRAEEAIAERRATASGTEGDENADARAELAEAEAALRRAEVRLEVAGVS